MRETSRTSRFEIDVNGPDTMSTGADVAVDGELEVRAYHTSDHEEHRQKAQEVADDLDEAIRDVLDDHFGDSDD